MRTLLIFLFTLLSINVSLSQTGVGYVNYTSYKTHNGNGDQSQYGAFPYTAAEFDNMLNTANTHTTITHTGEVTLATMCDGSTGTPHWGGDFYAIKFEFFFVPQETGTYSFGITSDDASDLAVNGSVIVSDYGGHGAGSWKYGNVQMVAGVRYSIVARYQEFGGGDALYVRWSRPSAPSSYSYWPTEVTNKPNTSLNFTFDFGTNVDETKFKTKMFTYSNYQSGPYTETIVGSGYKALDNVGKIDMTNDIDTIKSANNSYKANTTGGQVEWCVIYDYDNTNKRYRVGIDAREFMGTNVTPSTVNKLKLFDLWDGAVTYISYDPNGWAEYYINTNNQFNYGGSSYASFLRAGSGFYGVSAEFTFEQNLALKNHLIQFEQYTQLQTLLSQIVTVSDVYLAFKEFSDRGILGNSTGQYFQSGIQFQNADVNKDNVFDERDCFKLLRYLQGLETIWDTIALPNVMKLVPKETYNSITKTNWITHTPYEFIRAKYPTPLSENASNVYNLNVSWVGDVNLSHSAIPTSFVGGIPNSINSIASMAVKMNSVSSNVEANFITEIVGDTVLVTLKVNPNGNQIFGTQFNIYYDDSKLTYSGIVNDNQSITNFARNMGSLISVGSLSMDNSNLSNIGYTLRFKPKTNIANSIGLISVESVETIGINVNKLNVKIK